MRTWSHPPAPAAATLDAGQRPRASRFSFLSFAALGGDGRSHGGTGGPVPPPRMHETHVFARCLSLSSQARVGTVGDTVRRGADGHPNGRGRDLGHGHGDSYSGGNNGTARTYKQTGTAAPLHKHQDADAGAITATAGASTTNTSTTPQGAPARLGVSTRRAHARRSLPLPVPLFPLSPTSRRHCPMTDGVACPAPLDPLRPILPLPPLPPLPVTELAEHQGQQTLVAQRRVSGGYSLHMPISRLSNSEGLINADAHAEALVDALLRPRPRPQYAPDSSDDRLSRKHPFAVADTESTESATSFSSYTLSEVMDFEHLRQWVAEQRALVAAVLRHGYGARDAFDPPTALPPLHIHGDVALELDHGPRSKDPGRSESQGSFASTSGDAESDPAAHVAEPASHRGRNGRSRGRARGRGARWWQKTIHSAPFKNKHAHGGSRGGIVGDGAEDGQSGSAYKWNRDAVFGDAVIGLGLELAHCDDTVHPTLLRAGHDALRYGALEMNQGFSIDPHQYDGRLWDAERWVRDNCTTDTGAGGGPSEWTGWDDLTPEERELRTALWERATRKFGDGPSGGQGPPKDDHQDGEKGAPEILQQTNRRRSLDEWTWWQEHSGGVRPAQAESMVTVSGSGRIAGLHPAGSNQPSTDEQHNVVESEGPSANEDTRRDKENMGKDDDKTLADRPRGSVRQWNMPFNAQPDPVPGPSPQFVRIDEVICDDNGHCRTPDRPTLPVDPHGTITKYLGMDAGDVAAAVANAEHLIANAGRPTPDKNPGSAHLLDAALSKILPYPSADMENHPSQTVSMSGYIMSGYIVLSNPDPDGGHDGGSAMTLKLRGNRHSLPTVCVQGRHVLFEDLYWESIKSARVVDVIGNVRNLVALSKHLTEVRIVRLVLRGHSVPWSLHVRCENLTLVTFTHVPWSLLTRTRDRVSDDGDGDKRTQCLVEIGPVPNNVRRFVLNVVYDDRSPGMTVARFGRLPLPKSLGQVVVLFQRERRARRPHGSSFPLLSTLSANALMVRTPLVESLLDEIIDALQRRRTQSSPAPGQRQQQITFTVVGAEMLAGASVPDTQRAFVKALSRRVARRRPVGDPPVAEPVPAVRVLSHVEYAAELGAEGYVLETSVNAA